MSNRKRGRRQDRFGKRKPAIFESLEDRASPGSLLGLGLADLAGTGRPHGGHQDLDHDTIASRRSAAAPTRSVGEGHTVPKWKAAAAKRSALRAPQAANRLTTGIPAPSQVAIGKHFGDVGGSDSIGSSAQPGYGGGASIKPPESGVTAGRFPQISGNSVGAAESGGATLQYVGVSTGPTGSSGDSFFIPPSAQPSASSQVAVPAPATIHSETATLPIETSPVTPSGAADRPALPSPAPFPAAIRLSGTASIGFSQGLAGWKIDVAGGSDQGRGSVTHGSAILREGDSFLVSLEQSFIVPAHPAPLAFHFTELNFDTSDPDSINDAFEASLVDDAGHTLVHGFSAARDAFFNITEGLDPALGPRASHDVAAVQTVSLDLNEVAPGTKATIRFRLVNNDQDTETSVRILDVIVPSDNSPPELATLGDIAANEGDRVTVSASFSDADLADSHTATIDWGDGTVGPADISEADGLGTATAKHVYADNGNYAIGVTVRDLAGATAAVSATARIANVAPTVTGSDFDAVKRTPFSRIVATFSDAAFTSVAAGTQETFTASIDWGDGTPVEPGSISVVPGTAGVPTTGTVSGSHNFASAGTYSATVVVGDDDSDTGRTTFKIHVAAFGSTKFFVVDPANKGTFRYDPVGNSIDRTGLAPADSAPRGIASTVAGDTVWVIDAARKVYVYSSTGQALGSWTAGTLSNPTDIATDGTDIWIVDSGRDKVFRFANAASRRSGHQGPISSFSLANDDTNPSGIVTDGATLWVTDDGAKTDRVFVYSLTGQKLGSWNLDPVNAAPSGITLNPSGGTDLWVVDRDDTTVYHYSDATTRRSGTQAVADSFKLAASNKQPEGIADPPVTDPNDSRSWQGATVATFATLLYGSSTAANRQKLIDNKVLDDGRFDVSHLTFPATLRPNSGDGGCIGRSTDSTGSGSFDYYCGATDLFTAANTIDDLWFQSSGTIGSTVFDLGAPATKAAVFNTIDHGPLPQEAIESTVYLSNDLSNWKQAVVERIWLEGWHSKLGVKWDGFAYAVGTGTNDTFRYASVIHGGPGALIDDGDNEINGILGLDNDFTPVQPGLPKIHVDSPADATKLAVGKVLVSGTAIADHIAVSTGLKTNQIIYVNVNGAPVDVLDNAGNFFTRVDVLPGQNTFTFSAVDAYAQTATVTLNLEGVQPPAGAVDFSLLSDVSASFAPDYARTSFNEDANVLYADWAIRNSGQYPTDIPLYVGVTNISDPRVMVHDPVGLTPDGIPYFDFTSLVPGGRLEPNQDTGTATLSFFDPERVQFTYDLVFFGMLNRAPAITSVPDVEALADRSYSYDVEATDPDGDPVTYSLVNAPPHMTIDAASGLISWKPTLPDIGSQSVTVRAVDGRGGSTEQHYVLSVTAPAPNRPPVFTSVPAVSGNVNIAYSYDADATDPDGDTLVFSLVTAPGGLLIDSGTGLISWTPDATQLGTHDITISVDDGHGGLASQTFLVLVEQEPGNHPPVIVTQPVTAAVAGQSYSYDVDAIDPDSDPLAYSLTTAPAGMTIAQNTGLISWNLVLPSSVIAGPITNPANGHIYYLLAPSTWTDAENDAVKLGGHLATIRSQSENDWIYSQFSSFKGTDRGLWIGLNDATSEGHFSWISGEAASFSDWGAEEPRNQNGLDDYVHLLWPGDPRQSRWNDMWDEGLGGTPGYYVGIPINGVVEVVDPDVTVRVDDGRGGSDTQNFTIDISTSAPAAIRGTKFNDLDGDGTFDSGEPGLAGWTIYLDQNQNNTRDAGERSTVTGEDGGYVFTGLVPSTYIIAEELIPPTNLIPTVTSTSVLGEKDYSDGSLLSSNNTWLQVQTNEPLPFKKLHVAPATIEWTFEEIDVSKIPVSAVLQFSLWDLDNDFDGAQISLFTLNGVVQPIDIFEIPDPNEIVRIYSIPIDTGLLTGGSLAVALSIAGPPSGNEVGIDFTRLDVTTRDEALRWVQTAPLGGVHQVALASGQLLTDLNFGNSLTDLPITNRNPGFTSAHRTDATIGQLYRYDAKATDPDNDVLTFDPVVKPTGMAVDPATGIVVWVPTADQVGHHDVILRVQDGRGGVDLQSFRIAVTRPNSTPIITSTPKGPAVVAVPYQYRVTAQDADGDALTFQLDSNPAGMVIDTVTGLVSWTPAADQVGTRQVAITVDDGHGHATTQLFDLPVVATAPNDPPTITSTPRGTVRIDDQYLYQTIASDPNSDPLTFSLPTAPNGMSIDNAGLVTWQLIAGQLGPNPVQVQVADGRGGTVTQSFTVNVVTQASNQAPSIVSTPPQTGTVGQPYAYDVRATDPDGDPLTFIFDESPAGMSIDAALGTIRWTPTADQLGPQSVVVRALDNLGGWSTQSFSVQVRAVNVPPGISSTPPTEAVATSVYSYPVRATDPDGDPLAFTLTQAPAGMTIDSASGLIQWTPSATQVGSQSVSIAVNDGQGGTATQTYTVVVSATALNRPPVITSTPSFSATSGNLYSYPVTALDPEGAALLFSLQVAPTGMFINPTTGLLQWTPSATQLASQRVIVAAIDPAGNAGTQSFLIEVTDANSPPTITSSPVQTVTAGLPYRYDVRATDPDGDPISYQLDSAPTGMTIDRFGRITWSPAIANIGTQRIAVTVADTHGASQTQTFDLAVLADGQTPRVNLVVSQNPVEVGTPVTFVVTATDNVAVAAIGLTINGNSVALDARGRVTLVAEPAGEYRIVASASDAAGNTGLASTSLLVVDTSDTEAPTVEITSPSDNAVITAPTDVLGTASDSNLLDYTLLVAPLGSSTFQELFRGTSSVTNGVLGKFDPTGLTNDTYTLRLSATDAGGNTSSVDTVVAVAGDLKVGNFTLSFTDLTVPVSGIPITVSRTYDTLQSHSQDELGFGWRLEFRDTDLRTSVPSSGEEEFGVYTPFNQGARVYVTAPGGRREGFTFEPKLVSGFGGLFGFYNPKFVPDAGVTSRLSVPDVTLIRSVSDGLFYAANGLPYNPQDELNFGGRYFLTTKDGIAYEIDANTGDLQTLSDTHGNALTFSDESIDSNRGPRVTFQRDPQGRIIGVTDPLGNQVHYRYDPQGDLTAATDRDGNITQFVYGLASRPHYLTAVIDPLGRTGVRTEYDAQGRLIKLIDAAGNPVQLIHDPDNAIETIKDVQGHTTTFEYDLHGNVVTEVDAAGGITRRTYDGANNTLTETDPLGNVTSFSYDGDGNVLTETDPLGNVTRFTYTTVTPGFFDRVKGARPVSLLTTTTDPLGNTTLNSYLGTNLVSTRDAVGFVTSYSYDDAGNQTAITDAAGNVTHFDYDGSGNLLRQVDALGHATTFTYDAAGNQRTQTTTLTTPVGVRTLVTSMDYDANGHPTSVTDAEGHTTRTEYDKLGNQLATIDALGHRTEFTYDDRGQLAQTHFADGTSTIVTYDVLGHRISSTDRAGRVTRFEYDPLGRLTASIYPDATPADDADNPRTRTEYDAVGRVAAQIDELGHRTEFEYDAAGRQTVVRDALGNETRTSYDPAGRTRATTDALDHTTQFAYDALGRQIQTLFADGTTTSNEYDALGRSVAQTDQAGRVTQYEYDPLGRLAAVVDALGQRTVYGYDEAGDLITQQDANGHITRYEYDGLGRRIATQLPLGQRSSSVYDPLGNIASTTDFNGDTIVFHYDVSSRLTSKDFPDGTSVSFTYTPTGQRETYTDARGVTHWSYDERNRLISRTDPDARAITYTYDAAGNRTSLTVASGTTTYRFDALNRSDTVTDPEGGVTHYTYDAASRLTRTDLPNGTWETRDYNTVNRLTFLENRSPTEVISSYRYTLSPTGRRDTVVENNGRRVDYGYDALDRLTREAITDTIFGNRAIDYTYDPVGNRNTRNDSVEGLTAYTYDDNDRLLTETLAGQVTQYGYDANGNTLSKQSATDHVFYDWDFENRLLSADTDGNGTADVAYRYDADGIRVSSTSAGQETRFLIDTVQPYQQVLEEYTPSGVIKVSYVHGLDLISQNRPAETGKSFYHVDGLGSTRALTNGSGLVTDTYIYDAFGRTILQSGVTGNVYLFAGEQRDAATGLDYLRARWMSTGVGRFYGRDPFSGVLRDPVTLHRFLYANANPANLVDPSGQFTLVELSVTTAVLGILTTIAVPKFRNYVASIGVFPRMPFDRSLVSSEFGERIHPITGARTFHEGVDYDVDEGTRVNAVEDGRVAISYLSQSFGEAIIIDHGADTQGSRYYTLYAHNSLRRVTTGQTVTDGQHIADSGNTGISTGPHLHYEVRVIPSGGPNPNNGQFFAERYAVDPLRHRWPLILRR